MKDFLFVVVITQIFGIKSFDSRCSTNQTMFIPKGFAASFASSVYIDPVFPQYTYFAKSDTLRLYLRIDTRSSPPNITDENVRIFDLSIMDRTVVSGSRTSPTSYNITILIRKIEQRDNGTYQLYDNSRYTINCWILFVIDIKQQPVGYIVENEAVQISAQPAASLMVRPVVNATMLWLLDGSPINLTEQFLVKDGALWTAKIPRKFNGKIVTYRALQDNGQMVDINLTLEISYGPDSPLLLEPEKSYYMINNGDKMPDISCQAYCNPPCAISWGQHSSDHILRLNQVSPSSSGEYTCTATNENGATRVVTRTIFVNVLDNTVQIATFAVLATVQFLTTTFLGIVCICYCIRSGKIPCKQCAENSLFKGEETKEDQSPPTPNENHGVELEGYEDLDLGSSTKNHYSTPTTAAGQDVPRMEVYENTRISQSDRENQHK